MKKSSSPGNRLARFLLAAVLAPLLLALPAAARPEAEAGTQKRSAALLAAEGLWSVRHRSRTGSSWLRAWFHGGSLDSRPGMPDITLRGSGIVAGFDRRIGRGTDAGLAFAAARMKMRGRGALNGTDSDSASLGASLYAVRHAGTFTILADAGLDWQSADVTAAAAGRIFRVDDAKSRMFRGGVQIFWNLPRRGALSVSPFAGLRWRRLEQKEFTAGGLLFEIDDAAQWTIPVGLRFEWRCPPTRHGWCFQPSLSVAYERVTGDRGLTIRQRLPSGRELAHYDTSPLDRALFRLTAGLEARRRNLSVALGLGGRIGRHQRSLSGSFAPRWDM